MDAIVSGKVEVGIGKFISEQSFTTMNQKTITVQLSQSDIDTKYLKITVNIGQIIILPIKCVGIGDGQNQWTNIFGKDRRVFCPYFPTSDPIHLHVYSPYGYILSQCCDLIEIGTLE